MRAVSTTAGLVFAFSFSFSLVEVLRAQECPQYPRAARDEQSAAVERDRGFAVWSAARRQVPGPNPAIAPARNFIDELAFGKMERDSVAPANVAGDAEFLRRVSLDLTGRIPQPEEAEAFFANRDPEKRKAFITRLLASPAYVDHWTTLTMDRFQVTRDYPTIGAAGNMPFHTFVRRLFETNQPYDAWARSLITASGDIQKAPSGWVVVSQLRGESMADTWDNLTDVVTTQFLGIKTECISCHNGRGYLESVNLYLSKKQRRDFWGMSAFFSRTAVNIQLADAEGTRTWIVSDRDRGSYVGTVDPVFPGIRPPRLFASTDPVYLFDGRIPSSEAWRSELAEMITRDRQFARATVNYLWAGMFGSGIVDPPNAWDPLRVDPANPPPEPWPVQNSHPELLERLADFFIQNNYSIRAVLGLMADSNLYQLSSVYPAGQWKAAFSRYFAKRLPHRMTAEQMFDSLVTATQTETAMTVGGLVAPVYYASQLPDVAEPLSDQRIKGLLSDFGRGNWTGSQPRSNRASLAQQLALWNDDRVLFRTEIVAGGWSTNRAKKIAAESITDTEAVKKLYLATLTRLPSDAELTAILARRPSQNRLAWISTVQWALVNKLDFLFY